MIFGKFHLQPFERKEEQYVAGAAGTGNLA